jgi:hypothetical protein
VGTDEPKFLSPQTYTPQYLAEKILGSRNALEGERKQVTVLFADLKGSMELLADRAATQKIKYGGWRGSSGTRRFAQSAFLRPYPDRLDHGTVTEVVMPPARPIVSCPAGKNETLIQATGQP